MGKMNVPFGLNLDINSLLIQPRHITVTNRSHLLLNS